MNPTCRIITAALCELAGEQVLDMVGASNVNVTPSGFTFFQSFYVLRSGITGKQWVVET